MSVIFAWVLSYLEVPQMIVTALFSITRDKHMILLMLNILFLSFSGGAILEGVVQLYFYRRGVTHG